MKSHGFVWAAAPLLFVACAQLLGGDEFEFEGSACGSACELPIDAADATSHDAQDDSGNDAHAGGAGGRAAESDASVPDVAFCPGLVAKPRNYAEFAAAARKLEPSAGRAGYLIEGDLLLADDTALERYYEAYYTADAIGTDVVPRIANALYDFEQRAVAFCIADEEWGGAARQVGDAADRAAAAWENVADVYFRRRDADSTDCAAATALRITNANDAAFVIAVNHGDTGRVDEIQLGSDALDFDLVGALTHAFGHVLGLDHSHPPSCTPPGCSDLSTYRRHSIMRHTWCADGLTTHPYPGQIDVDTLAHAYGSPAQVVAASDGTLFARTAPRGGVHRLAESGWETVAAGATRSILTRAATLYRVTSGHVLEQYFSNERIWLPLLDGVSEVHTCGGVCALSTTDGSISRFVGYWHRIGGPARRYASTLNDLYRITLGNELEWYHTGDDRWIRLANVDGDLDTGADSVLVYDAHYGEGAQLIGRLSAYRASTQSWLVQPLAIRSVLGLDTGYAAVALATDELLLSTDGAEWQTVANTGMRLDGAADLYLIEPSGRIQRRDAANGSWTDLGTPAP